MISVIIPTYNSIMYICDAIDSVLDQTYKDFEILVIDDGSTDETKKMVTNKYPEVQYHYLSHNGVSHARNFGITNAKGEYIAFLDADDKWLPKKLELQLACFKSFPTLGMVFTETLNFDNNSIWNNNLSKRERIMKGDIVKNIFFKSYVGTSTVMVKKEVFSNIGLFSESLTIGEDDNMWMRIAFRYAIELVDEPLILFRNSESSLTKKDNFFVKVYRSIRTLQRKHPEISRHLGEKAFRSKFSTLFFHEGYLNFEKKQYLKALRFFAYSYSFNILSYRCLLFCIFCLLPSQIKIPILTIKQYFKV